MIASCHSFVKRVKERLSRSSSSHSKFDLLRLIASLLRCVVTPIDVSVFILLLFVKQLKVYIAEFVLLSLTWLFVRLVI